MLISQNLKLVQKFYNGENCEMDILPWGEYNLNIIGYSQSRALREKCPNAELFLVHIFLLSDWMPKFTE